MIEIATSLISFEWFAEKSEIYHHPTGNRDYIQQRWTEGKRDEQKVGERAVYSGDVKHVIII